MKREIGRSKSGVGHSLFKDFKESGSLELRSYD